MHYCATSDTLVKYRSGLNELAGKALIAYMVAQIIFLNGCAPNRAEWMAEAAHQEAASATSEMGNEQEVKAQARTGSEILRRMAALMLKDASGSKQQQMAAAFGQDTDQVTAGLDAIANSNTDDGFVNAVFAMCDTQRVYAAPRVGRMLLGLARLMRATPPPNVPAQQVQQEVNYLETFGGRLVNIPTQCDQAKAQMVQASTQEQQAEVQQQAKVNAAVSAAALLFVGAVVVGAAAASRPVTTTIQTNNYYGN